MTADIKRWKTLRAGNIVIPWYPDVIFVVPLSAVSLTVVCFCGMWAHSCLACLQYMSMSLLQLRSHKALMHLFLIKQGKLSPLTEFLAPLFTLLSIYLPALVSLSLSYIWNLNIPLFHICKVCDIHINGCILFLFIFFTSSLITLNLFLSVINCKS